MHPLEFPSRLARSPEDGGIQVIKTTDSGKRRNREDGSSGSCCRRPVAMIQNTLVEIASALIRDWRMYWARACMMA